ncbi:MAG TPA: hypothetical protein VFW62_11565, partial [bacterium]|nr:hypothetical protein [bacterium]
MSFAARRETEHPELAGLLYQSVAQLEEAPAELRRRAQNRSAALQGNGTFGAQAEVLISRFSKEALNPAPILAMGVAGSLFKISRALSLNVLRHSPIDRVVSKITANGVGLLTESAAFTLTAKSVASGLGQTQDWSIPALKREWLAGTILLGSIKAGGALGVQTARTMAGGVARTESLALQRGLSFAAGLSQPLGLYSGILLSHQIETGLGLRAAQGPANTLIDGAATLAHLYVGGRLAQGLGAERLNRAATEIEFRIGNIPGPRNGSPLSNFLNPAPAIAMAAKAGESLAWQPEVLRPYKSQALEATAFAPERNYIQEAYDVRDFLQRLPEATGEHIA